MDKKAGEISHWLLITVLVVISILVFTGVLTAANRTGERSIKRFADDHLNQLNNSGVEDQLKGFEDIRVTGKISDATINNAENFLDQITLTSAEKQKTTKNKKPILIVRPFLEPTESGGWYLTIHDINLPEGSGIIAYFDNGIRQYVLEKPSDKSSQLYGKRLCVISSSRSDEPIKKFLSYITQKELANGKTTSLTDLKSLLSENEVQSVSFEVGPESEDNPQMYYSSSTDGTDYFFKNGEMWVLLMDQYICFITLEKPHWYSSRDPVHFDSEDYKNAKIVGNTLLSSDLNPEAVENLINSLSSKPVIIKKFKR